MENQHRQIKGYRELNQREVELMNKIKDLAEQTGRLVNELYDTADAEDRWVAIGCTHLQEGYMALTRSVAKPTTF